MIAEKINDIISEYGAKYKDNVHEMPEDAFTYIGTETIGEVIEKLLILNIRIWILEDEAALAKLQNRDSDYISYKRKLDVCFKIKRPNLVAALNYMFVDIADRKNLTFCKEGNIKVYKNE